MGEPGEVTNSVASLVHLKLYRYTTLVCVQVVTPYLCQIFVPESKTYLQPVWLHSEVCVCVCGVSVVAVVHTGGFGGICVCMVHT